MVAASHVHYSLLCCMVSLWFNWFTAGYSVKFGLGKFGGQIFNNFEAAVGWCYCFNNNIQYRYSVFEVVGGSIQLKQLGVCPAQCVKS